MVRLLYNYLPGRHGQFVYRPVACFTDRGPVSREVLNKVYREGWPEGERLDFESLADLQQFSLALLEKLKLKHCYLLSKDSYNEGVQEVSNQEQLQQLFTHHGELLTNHHIKSKGGFFGKLWIS